MQIYQQLLLPVAGNNDVYTLHVILAKVHMWLATFAFGEMARISQTKQGAFALATVFAITLQKRQRRQRT